MLKALFVCFTITQILISQSWANEASRVVISPVSTATCTEGERVKNIYVTKMLEARKVQEDEQALTLEFDLAYYTCSDLATQALDFLTDLAYVDMKATPKQSQKSLAKFNFVYTSTQHMSVQATINKFVAFAERSTARFGLALYPFGPHKASHDFGGYSSTWIIDLTQSKNETQTTVSPLQN
jgi:hypothetical protein